MTNRRIVSPMPRGSGAYIVHRLLELHIQQYQLIDYNPHWTLLPFLLSVAASPKDAKLIHTTPDYASFFAQKSVPLLITFHNYVLDTWMRPYSSWAQRIHYASDLRLWTKLALKKAHAITAVSHFTANLVRKDLNISRPVKVIYNGIDVNQFTPPSSPRSPMKEIRVFFSGNLIRRKGSHWLPSIAKQLQKNIRIFYTQGLRTKNNLSPHPELQPIGSVPFDEIHKLYQEMDILLMPTVREGFGLAVAEAMACGLPVVASDCSAIPELIDHGKGGYLCPVGDVNAFAEKINFLADSPNLRCEMGEYNRAKIEKMFTLDRMVKEYHELFEEMLN